MGRRCIEPFEHLNRPEAFDDLNGAQRWNDWNGWNDRNYLFNPKGKDM
jgi:hypothetical protein